MRQDEFILYMDNKYWKKRKHKKAKVSTTKKTARSEMRLLAQLFMEATSFADFISSNRNITELFCRENFYHLADAVDKINERKSGKIKAGLRHKAYYQNM